MSQTSIQERNIVLLVVDTLRRKDIAEKNDIAPFLSERGTEYYSLDNYYSTAAWTGPAHASMFSGKLPSEHGYTTKNCYFEDKNILLDALEEFHTVGLSTNASISESTGMLKGFDQFKNYQEKNRGGEVWREIWEKDKEFSSRKEKWLLFTKESILRRDTKSIGRFLNYVKEQKLLNKGPKFYPRDVDEVFDDLNEELSKPRNSFIFVNISPVHWPYTFTSEEKEKFLPDLSDEEALRVAGGYEHEDYFSGDLLTEKFLEDRKRAYHASIRYSDRKIKNLYEEAPENTVFMVLGDHGELFGEYELADTSIIGHHLGTFKELLTVPFFIFSKSEVEVGIDADSLYDHRDVPALVKSVTDGSRVEGRDLIRAEYFGTKGYYDQFNQDLPEEIPNEVLQRKSFSLINNELKFDLTTDGSYTWPKETQTENEEKEQVPEELESKAKILYSHMIK